MKLPSMVYASQKSEVEQVVFGGLNHSESAGASEFYEMSNVSSDLYPILSPRKRRWKILEETNIRYLCAVGNALYFMEGTKLCKTKTTEKTAVENGTAEMAVVESVYTASTVTTQIVCVFGKRLILKEIGWSSTHYVVYDTESGEARNMDASYAGSVVVGDSTLYGVSASANKIELLPDSVGFDELNFRAGDGVRVEVFSMEEGEGLLTTDAVIRELDGRQARFDDNLFSKLPKMGSYKVAIGRKVPDFAYLCACDNRLFACSGDSVYASALGDPFNWYVFDGLSTDSWSTETGGGDFTGCTEYLGCPCFFKVDAIYKLYGDYPTEYQLVKTSAYGVKEGSEKTLAVVGNTLFYLSPKGVCAYSDGYPSVILPPEQMGGYPTKGGSAAGDGRKYYLQLWEPIAGAASEWVSGKYTLFVYDTETGVWHKEDGNVNPACVSGYPGTTQLNIFGIGEDGLWLMGSPAFTMDSGESGADEIGMIEDPVESFVEFGEGYHDTLSAKKLWRLHIRLWVAKGAKLKISVSYDGGKYKVLREFGQTDKRSYVIPIAAKRCDHYRLRIDGVGEYKIYALAREYAVSGER